MGAKKFLSIVSTVAFATASLFATEYQTVVIEKKWKLFGATTDIKDVKLFQKNSCPVQSLYIYDNSSNIYRSFRSSDFAIKKGEGFWIKLSSDSRVDSCKINLPKIDSEYQTLLSQIETLKKENENLKVKLSSQSSTTNTTTNTNLTTTTYSSSSCATGDSGTCNETYTMNPYQGPDGYWYTPQEKSVGNIEEGVASWYNGWGLTACGIQLDETKFTAAHRTLPMNTMVKVTNKENGKCAVVKITDRGPFLDGRIIDVTTKVAEVLDMFGPGIVPVTIEVVDVSKVVRDFVPMDEPLKRELRKKFNFVNYD